MNIAIVPATTLFIHQPLSGEHVVLLYLTLTPKRFRELR
jgi:hypothetical protein